MFLMILFKILIYELEKNVFFWIYDCFMVFNDFLWLFYDFFYASFYDLFMIFLWLIFFRPRRPNKIMKENKKNHLKTIFS